MICTQWYLFKNKWREIKYKSNVLKAILDSSLNGIMALDSLDDETIIS